MQVKIIFILLVLLSNWSCVDELNMTPENSITFGNIQTEKDIESLVKGTGQKVRDYAQVYNYSLQLKGEYMDKVDSWFIPYRTLDPTRVQTNTWENVYSIIVSANNVLDWVDETDMSQERKLFYKGQCYFYIALAYLELIQCYGDCVLRESKIEWEPVAKSPWTQVADFAIKKAEDAAHILPELDKITDSEGKAPQYKSVPCKGAANAVLAYLCAWKAGCKYMAQPKERNYDERKLWERAEQACTEIIDSPNYELASTAEEICTKVLVGGHPESLYETVFRDLWHEFGENNDFAINSMCTGYIGWPVMPHESASDIKNKGYGIYSSTVKKMFPGDDERKYAYFYKFEEMAHPDSITKTGGLAYPYKLRELHLETEGDDIGEFRAFNVNKIWWRLADIYLLRAECRARLGGDYINGAIADLNKVRGRSKGILYDKSEYGGDLRYAIFKEREKELLMEGYRYFDIVRNGYVRQELEGRFKTLSDQDMIDGALFLAITPGKYVSAFFSNPLMRQNTYWQRFM